MRAWQVCADEHLVYGLESCLEDGLLLLVAWRLEEGAPVDQNSQIVHALRLEFAPVGLQGVDDQPAKREVWWVVACASTPSLAGSLSLYIPSTDAHALDLSPGFEFGMGALQCLAIWIGILLGPPEAVHHAREH